MKILIVSDIPTSPTSVGSRRMIISYVSLFKSMGYEVHFLFVNKFNMRKKYRIAIKDAIIKTQEEWRGYYHQYDCSLGENVYTNLNILFDKLFRNGYRNCDDIYPQGLTSKIANLHSIYCFDALLVNYFYLSKALDAIPIKRKALFTHDAFSLQKKSQKHQAVYYLTKKEEKKALLRAPYIFAMQDVEAEYFKSLSPNSIVLTNYTNCQYHAQSIMGNHNILYLAADTFLNLDGIKWFIKSIYPLIKQNFSDAKLLIAGRICNSLAELSVNNDIELIREVDDLYSFYQMGDVAINPCRLGTGLKIKTFEAISYDKVVLSHPNGLIGIFETKEAPVFSSDKATDWLEYLEKVWSSYDVIKETKMKNHDYIQKMNDYVIEQYKIWLK